jgi:hypothetical protein
MSAFITGLPTIATYFIDSYTASSTVLPEKLTGSQLVKKFPAFYGPEGSLPH